MSYLSERKCRACGEKQEMIGLNGYVDKYGVFYICHNCIRTVMNNALFNHGIRFKETASMIHQIDYEAGHDDDVWYCVCDNYYETLNGLIDHIKEETTDQLNALNEAQEYADRYTE